MQRTIKITNTEFYLFGSSLFSSDFNDIDILILFEASSYSDYIKALEVRRQLTSSLEKIFHKEVDITLLTFKENREINFTGKENAQLLLRVPHTQD
ncbi:hypothetical protein [Anaerobacillus sp. 1_MG-2023]|uniref:hypothetical protein n=1 Tax=Anaerobacillus sp. 1_MG-2023 TaxID=3062655 RepID=UPI0026E3C239|nr:hypothetical protein [Anaerobacillus sp. 1_MG-2023]MDO6658001.1 hypothetical protein [Anaerobacillus sp. 1_MG-2023]